VLNKYQGVKAKSALFVVRPARVQLCFIDKLRRADDVYTSASTPCVQKGLSSRPKPGAGKLCVGLMPESMLSIWDPKVLLLGSKMIACKASTCPNTASDAEYTMVRHIGRVITGHVRHQIALSVSCFSWIVCMQGPCDLQASCTRRSALERQDLSCMYLAHHELEGIFVIIIIIIIIMHNGSF